MTGRASGLQKLQAHRLIWRVTRKRFYMYDDLRGLLDGLGHNKVPMNEGWYLERSTLKLYVRSLDDPSNHTWQVPRLNYAFEVASRDWLWIEGFEMQFYGAQTGGCGVCATNASHLVIRKNRIHNLQLGIYINWTGGDDQGNDTRIEYNEIYDPTVAAWPWNAVKGSSMENTAIVVRGHSGAIVRGNDLHHFFNGIYTGSSGALENSALALMSTSIIIVSTTLLTMRSNRKALASTSVFATMLLVQVTSAFPWRRSRRVRSGYCARPSPTTPAEASNGTGILTGSFWSITIHSGHPFKT
jgi:hypothetical protein